VEQEMLLEILEVVVVLEVLVKLLMQQMVVMVDLVCNYQQHLEILHQE
tara:strand:+ start:375 stop:518 length:144 start_codon:yes stop_codon:yes gene_type:complete